MKEFRLTKRYRKNTEPDQIQCPTCWEKFSIAIDEDGGEVQEFVYDCPVCCRPMDIVYTQGKGFEVKLK